MQEKLIQLGFHPNEATIYMALIELGPTGTGEIIKKTSLHRNIVYETLDKLIAKGYVSQFKLKKVAQFKVTDPQRILDGLKNTVNLAEEIIPSLVAKAGSKQDVVTWEGVEGFRNFTLHLVENMEVSSTFYVIGSVGDRWYELMGDSVDKYYRAVKKKKIHGKSVIYNPTALDENQPNYQVRALPLGFEPPADMVVWGDSIALQCLIEPYSVIEIKNPALAKAYLAYFQLLWEQAK